MDFLKFAKTENKVVSVIELNENNLYYEVALDVEPKTEEGKKYIEFLKDIEQRTERVYEAIEPCKNSEIYEKRGYYLKENSYASPIGRKYYIDRVPNEKPKQNYGLVE